MQWIYVINLIVEDNNKTNKKPKSVTKKNCFTWELNHGQISCS